MEEDNCSHILKHKNYYDILGIDKNSNTEEIRKAYKKLAVKYHPDKSNHPPSEFIKLLSAYKRYRLLGSRYKQCTSTMKFIGFIILHNLLSYQT